MITHSKAIALKKYLGHKYMLVSRATAERIIEAGYPAYGIAYFYYPSGGEGWGSTRTLTAVCVIDKAYYKRAKIN